VAEFHSPALDAGLHARQSAPEQPSSFLLRPPLELDERERVPVRGREPRDERRDAARELREGREPVTVAFERRLFELGTREPSISRCPALVVDEGAAGDLVDPGPEALLLPELAESTEHAHEGVLQDIVDVRLRPHAARDERTQLRFELPPPAPRRRVNHADAPVAQQDGPQHDFAPPGFTASIVAEAT
jgi:hypothetical protein